MGFAAVVRLDGADFKHRQEREKKKRKNENILSRMWIQPRCCLLLGCCSRRQKRVQFSHTGAWLSPGVLGQYWELRRGKRSWPAPTLKKKREREKKQQLTNWETRQKKMVKDYTESTTTHVSCCFFLPASSFIITGYLQSIVYMYERCHQYLTMSENRVDKV